MFRALTLKCPAVMGILNVTPDSFSDGGLFVRRDDALRQLDRMLEDGADIIDVGGESTRPGAIAVDAATEIQRVIPIIEAIRKRSDVPVSVDTSKPEVMQAAVAAGASMVNDVTALQAEGALEMAASLEVAVCLMHMQGQPRTMQKSPHYVEVVDEVTAFLADRMAQCRAAGIDTGNILIDPGFGFGKNDEHNLRLLANLRQICGLGVPVLVGLSRKMTLGHLTGRAIEERLSASIAAAVIAVREGAAIIRAHDVRETVDALKIASAVRDAKL